MRRAARALQEFSSFKAPTCCFSTRDAREVPRNSSREIPRCSNASGAKNRGTTVWLLSSSSDRLRLRSNREAIDSRESVSVCDGADEVPAGMSAEGRTRSGSGGRPRVARTDFQRPWTEGGSGLEAVGRLNALSWSRMWWAQRARARMAVNTRASLRVDIGTRRGHVTKIMASARCLTRSFALQVHRHRCRLAPFRRYSVEKNGEPSNWPWIRFAWISLLGGATFLSTKYVLEASHASDLSKADKVTTYT